MDSASAAHDGGAKAAERVDLSSILVAKVCSSGAKDGAGRASERRVPPRQTDAVDRRAPTVFCHSRDRAHDAVETERWCTQCSVASGAWHQITITLPRKPGRTRDSGHPYGTLPSNLLRVLVSLLPAGPRPGSGPSGLRPGVELWWSSRPPPGRVSRGTTQWPLSDHPSQSE